MMLSSQRPLPGALLAVLLAAGVGCQEHAPAPRTGVAALFGAPVLGAEVGLDKPVMGPGGVNQETAAVASDGTGYLAVWADKRNGLGFDIYGARLDAKGKLLDAQGFLVAGGAGNRDRPGATFDGTNYVVVWEDSRTGAEYDIYAARVTTAGKVLDPSGIAVCTANFGQHSPAVAHHSSNTTLVVWEDGRGKPYYHIRGARLDSNLQLLGSSDIAIAASNYHTRHPTVAASTAGFLVAWTDSRSGKDNHIYGSLVDPTGKLSHSSGLAIAAGKGDRSYPSAAWDGAGYLVAWQDGRDLASVLDVYGTRVSVSGKVLDPAGLSIGKAPDLQEFPRVSRLGAAGFLVVWQDRRGTSFKDIYGARVSSAGKVLDQVGVPIGQAARYMLQPAVAHSSAGALVVWHGDEAGPTMSVYGARLDTAAKVLDPKGRLISRAANVQTEVAVARGSAGYLAVWQDLRNPSNGLDLYGGRLSSAGKALDPTGIAVSTAVDEQSAPAVAHGGGQYLAVWQDRRSKSSSIDIYGARLSAAGKVLDATGLAICAQSAEQSAPAVAYDGQRFLVVWMDRRHNATTGYDIYGARVSAAGKVLDPGGFVISAATGFQRSPAVAHDGQRFLVVWQDQRNGGDDIYGARVDGSGKVLDAKGLAICAATKTQQGVALRGAPGGGFLVAWQDGRGKDDDIWAARVSGAGKVLDPAGLTVVKQAKVQRRPSVAHDGSSYLVAWQDLRSGNPEVYLARVSGAGVVAPAGGARVAEPLASSPAAVGDSKWRFLVAYHRFAAGVTSGATRAMARFVSWKAPGIGCKTGGECSSGHCVDNMCCDTACGGGQGDCQACSVSAGAAKDGVCGVVKKGSVCRQASSVCDASEVCDGVKLVCPADAFKPAGSLCPGGVCQAGGICKPLIDAALETSPEAGAADAAQLEAGSDSASADLDASAGRDWSSPVPDLLQPDSEIYRQPDRPEAEGCGCRAGGRRLGGWWLVLLALLFGLRRANRGRAEV